MLLYSYELQAYVIFEPRSPNCLIVLSILLQLMDLLFSFLEPNRYHSALLAGYFSKVRLIVLIQCFLISCF